jgi:hypothetical protein
MKVGFTVGGRAVGPGQPTYRIADAAAHHGGDVQLGYKLIETAGAAGADAVVFHAPGNPGALPEREFKSLLGQAQYVGLTAFGTAADPSQVGFLASLDVPALVVASGDDALWRAAAATGKPLFVVAVGPEPDRPGAAFLYPGPSSLIEADGHVIMTPHTLDAARAQAAGRLVRKEDQRA